MEGKKYSKPFQGYSPRPDNTLPLNEARFEMINKDPFISTKVKKEPSVNFSS